MTTPETRRAERDLMTNARKWLEELLACFLNDRTSELDMHTDGEGLVNPHGGYEVGDLAMFRQTWTLTLHRTRKVTRKDLR